MISLLEEIIIINSNPTISSALLTLVTCFLPIFFQERTIGYGQSDFPV
jgi:hypothetical protein